MTPDRVVTGKGPGGEFCPSAPSVLLHPGDFRRACAIGCSRVPGFRARPFMAQTMLRLGLDRQHLVDRRDHRRVVHPGAVDIGREPRFEFQTGGAIRGYSTGIPPVILRLTVSGEPERSPRRAWADKPTQNWAVSAEEARRNRIPASGLRRERSDQKNPSRHAGKLGLRPHPIYPKRGRS